MRGVLALASAAKLHAEQVAPTLTNEEKTGQGHIAVVGAGFAGLTAACELRRLGYNVTLFDKHTQVGGRARTFTTDEGFTFDYGPSW